MTAAFNLSQLANNLNTSGQLDATDGLTGAVPVSNGGTGQSSLTSGYALIGSGTSAVSLVAPGTSGNVLTSNGSSWVSSTPAGGGGKVLQVVSTYSTTGYSTTSTTPWQDSGLSVTITPTSSSSKVLVLATISANGSLASTVYYLRIARNSTGLTGGGEGYGSNQVIPDSNRNFPLLNPMNYLDSPATTSATVYKIQWFKDGGTGGTIYLNGRGTCSSITAIEIGA